MPFESMKRHKCFADLLVRAVLIRNWKAAANLREKSINLSFCQGLKIISYIFISLSFYFVKILKLSSCILITILKVHFKRTNRLKSGKEPSPLPLDYGWAAVIENEWNNLAERGIINRDTTLPGILQWSGEYSGVFSKWYSNENKKCQKP